MTGEVSPFKVAKSYVWSGTMGPGLNDEGEPVSKFANSQPWDLIEVIGEVDACLTGLDRTLRASTSFDRDGQIVFSAASRGCELLLKLALCHIEIAEGRPWPAKSQLSNNNKGWGHKVNQMDERLRIALTNRISSHAQNVMLQGMIDAVYGNSIWPAFTKSLEIYGVNGRYEASDALGGSPLEGESYKDYWNKAENNLVDMVPELTPTRWDLTPSEYENLLMRHIADYFLRWRSMIGYMGMNGIMGEDGRSLGAQILPANPWKF